MIHDLAALCEGNLSAVGRRKLTKHLARCRACRAIHASLVPHARAEPIDASPVADRAVALPRQHGRAELARPTRDAPAACYLHVGRTDRPALRRHTVLFLAADPATSSRAALGQQCAEIQRELKVASHRDTLRFEVRWADNVDQVARHLGEVQPTIVHLAGHGGSGLMLPNDHGRPVGPRALAMTLAESCSRMVVLNACYTAAHGDALRSVTECVVGMPDEIGDDVARTFAVELYRALTARRSLGGAVEQALGGLNAGSGSEMQVPLRCTRDESQAARHLPLLGAGGAYTSDELRVERSTERQLLDGAARVETSF